jgi:murein DD-endopeptidase MepM/ murein hydrolase activator NlpD
MIRRSTTRRCFACANVLHAGQLLVLAQGRQRQEHCSEACMRATLRAQRKARARRRWRLTAVASLTTLLLAGTWAVLRHRAPGARSISAAWDDPQWKKPAAPQPITYGPAWPPTDDDWQFAFDRASWVYPLPGPTRHAPVADDRLFVTDAGRGRSAICRVKGACGVVLGGKLWGEHVYAALEGVVDRVSSGGGEDHGGGFVRIAHFGGMAFTQYFHLAAIPRGVVRGAKISAGEVIGLVGDTGTGGERGGVHAHLHFSLSVRPSAEFPETFWDPTPLMSRWTLRVPAHGSVAGLVAATNALETPRRYRGH